eukprot:Nitzschia sp. Nitz4//scaffold65_size103378//10353//10780//NITZ4_004454-RA/size103378-snap-gene-0.8-mRNA-1//-1//CDS//3329556204//190//frame0
MQACRAAMINVVRAKSDSNSNVGSTNHLFVSIPQYPNKKCVQLNRRTHHMLINLFAKNPNSFPSSIISGDEDAFAAALVSKTLLSGFHKSARNCPPLMFPSSLTT